MSAILSLSPSVLRAIIREAVEKSRLSRLKNNDTKEIAKKAGKISAEKYKTDISRQKAHSERMKLWWQERKKEQSECRQ